MENITLPVWLLCGLVGTGMAKDAVRWFRNGRNGKLPPGACPIARSVDPEDRPRRHTELLTDILASQREMTREVRKMREGLEAKM